MMDKMTGNNANTQMGGPTMRSARWIYEVCVPERPNTDEELRAWLEKINDKCGTDGALKPEIALDNKTWTRAEQRNLPCAQA